MTPPVRLQGLIFDLDGTLVDSAPDLRAALNRVLAEAGRPPLPLATVTRMIGDGAFNLVKRGFSATGVTPNNSELAAWVERFILGYEAAAAVETRPYPGVVDTLAGLRRQGLRLAVCTNKFQAASESLLRVLDLEQYFDAVIGGDKVPAQKPDPGHVRAALVRLEVDPAAAVMIGDSPNDVAAGRGAGLKVICLSYGYSRVAPAALGADILLDRFDAIPAALATLAGTVNRQQASPLE
ncbi:MAG: phosphoglycolate phosphatase [Alphaproteobacteria bacterium]|nr:phosphoglycolate phosphatase [Alphaproteobacteria bacterium]